MDELLSPISITPGFTYRMDAIILAELGTLTYICRFLSVNVE